MSKHLLVYNLMHLPRTTGLPFNQGKLNISSCKFPSRNEGTCPEIGYRTQLSLYIMKSELKLIGRTSCNKIIIDIGLEMKINEIGPLCIRLVLTCLEEGIYSHRESGPV